MVTLFQLFRDLIEFIRYPEVRHLVKNPDDPIPYEVSDV